MEASKHIASTAEEPLDTQAAARFIGMSASWLEKSRVRGDGPRFRKLGARVVYDREELRAWLETKGRASTAEYELKPKCSASPRQKKPITSGEPKTKPKKAAKRAIAHSVAAPEPRRKLRRRREAEVAKRVARCLAVAKAQAAKQREHEALQSLRLYHMEQAILSLRNPYTVSLASALLPSYMPNTCQAPSVLSPFSF
jgi:predicted DNA-binding transcriptional regulator AlpA